jgi:AcrR family transcriptional regulator
LVLELTLRVFVEEGYEAVTTRRIAKMAGISKKSLYAWFPDKYALLKEVNLQLRERLTAQRQPVDPSSSLETALYLLGRAQLIEAYQPEAFAIARFQAREGYKHAEFRQIIRSDYLVSSVVEITDTIRSRLPAGALNEDELNYAAMSFARLIGSQIVFTIMHNLPIPDVETIDAEARKSADILANGVRGMAQRTTSVTPGR